MNILVLNQNWFAEEWRAAGHKVYTCGLLEHLDLQLPTAHVHLDQAVALAPEKFEPDIIVAHDNSGPIVVTGLEDTEIPVIFYSVDTHHHHAIHKYLAHLFDHTFVAQKDYITQFAEVGSTAEWLPLWASRHIEASSDKRYEAVFVGNLNKELNPHRVWFFDELNKFTKVDTRIGKWWEIFPYSEIVVNQTVKGDLNFRVFEAMMSGAMLLTEKSPNGLFDLFEEDKHLATYPQLNPNVAAEKIQYYLANKSLARDIGHAGREEILKKHTPQIRAQTFMDLFPKIQKKQSPVKFLAASANYCDLGRRAETIDTNVSMRAYLSAMKCLDTAISKQELMDTQLACYAVCTCLKYDHFLKTGAGNELLNRAGEAYPDEPILKIAKLRNYLNQGQYELATQIAGTISLSPPAQIFAQSEEVIRMILDGKSFCL